MNIWLIAIRNIHVQLQLKTSYTFVRCNTLVSLYVPCWRVFASVLPSQVVPFLYGESSHGSLLHAAQYYRLRSVTWCRHVQLQPVSHQTESTHAHAQSLSGVSSTFSKCWKNKTISVCSHTTELCHCLDFLHNSTNSIFITTNGLSDGKNDIRPSLCSLLL